MSIDSITQDLIGAALTVHSTLGPGLLESTYEACLCFELSQRGTAFERQKALPVNYCGFKVDCGYRIDVPVEGQVIVELKCAERFHPIDTAQLLTYLRLSGLEVGVLINFNTILLTDGIKRVVNNYTGPATLRSQRPRR